MKPADLLQWYYMIFLGPFAVSAVLLVLSSLHGGRRHAHAGSSHHGFHLRGHVAGGHVAGHGAHASSAAGHAAVSHHAQQAGAPARASAARHAHDAAAPKGRNPHDDREAARPDQQGNGLLATLFGLGKAPAPILAQAFFLTWGFSGICADQILIHSPGPTAGQLLIALAIAAAVGTIGARFAAEVVVRLMPQDESLVVSRDSLFGLTGTIAFPVSTTAGRIMVYDDYGSLHDQTCRVANGHEPIEKGRKAIVVDVDEHGNLVVEELA
jgi:membrane protein implicated in regulation of membrane protease activity